jgi:hypothetical protein
MFLEKKWTDCLSEESFLKTFLHETDFRMKWLKIQENTLSKLFLEIFCQAKYIWGLAILKVFFCQKHRTLSAQRCLYCLDSGPCSSGKTMRMRKGPLSWDPCPPFLAYMVVGKRWGILWHILEELQEDPTVDSLTSILPA